MPYWYLSVIFLFLVIYFTTRRRKLAIVSKMINKRKSEDKPQMKELAKNFIGKDCLIYAFDGSHQYTGVVKEVSDNAMLVENNGTLEAINLDFVIRIREYPVDMKGKKKSVILD